MLFKRNIFRYSFIFFLTFFLINGVVSQNKNKDQVKNSIAKQDQVTPLLVSTLAVPTPVLLSDSRWYLVYELMVTNAIKYPITINSIRLVGAKNPTDVAAVLEKEKIVKNLFIPGVKDHTTTLQPGQTGYIRVDLSFKNKKQIPKSFKHAVAIKIQSPKDYILPSELVENVAPVIVPSDNLIIGPPLKGGVWVAVGVGPGNFHRTTIMPFRGQWIASERWAVDWVKISKDKKLTVGDPSKNESYLQYGQQIIAVADGKIVSVRNDMPDIKPGKLPSNISVQDATGNCVVEDIGKGYFAIYAHLQPGSAKVKVGDNVKKGQVLGLLGNSGNTDAPHLHFQIIKGGRFPLSHDGQPYVIDTFKLLGTIDSKDNLEVELDSSVPIKVSLIKGNKQRSNQMPENFSVVEFRN